MTNVRRVFLVITLALVGALGYYMWYQSQHLSVPVARLEIAPNCLLYTSPSPRD